MLRRRHKEQNSIVLSRLAKLPGSEESIRICFHVGALQRFHRGDNELNARFVLKVLELYFQFAAILRGHDIGLIDHAAAQRRIIKREGNEGCEDEKTGER